MEKNLLPLTRLGGLLLIATLVSAPARGQTREYAYATNSWSNLVSVVDTVTRNVVALIPVGMGPVDVAFTPDRSRAYVANSLSNTLSVIDTRLDRVVATVALEASPVSVAIATTPEGTFAYVPTYAVEPPGGSDVVVVINTDTNAIVATVPVGRTPGGMAFTPDRAFAWVTNSASHTVSIISTTLPPTVVSTVALGTRVPSAVAISPDGTFVYVAAEIFSDPNNVIWAISTTTHDIIAVIDLGDRANPGGIAFNSAGTRAYVPISLGVKEGGAGLREIDTASHTVTSSRGLGGEFFIATDVALTGDGNHVYVTGTQVLRGDANVVWVINTADLGLEATVNVREIPRGIQIGELQRPNLPRVACVAHFSITGSVSLINTDTLTLVGTVSIGGFLRGVVLSPNTEFAYAANYSDQSISVINTELHTADNPISLDQIGPTAIAVSPVNPAGEVFIWAGGVAFTGGDNVAVINADSRNVRTLRLDFTPEKIAITPDGSRAYIAVRGSYELFVIDTRTFDVTRVEIPPIGIPQALSISRDGAFVYIGASVVLVLETTNHTEVARVTTGAVNESGIAFNPDGLFAFVASGENNVRIVSRPDHTVRDTITLSRLPYGIGFTGGGGFAFVAVNDSSDVAVIETATRTIAARVPVLGSPQYVSAR